MMTATMGSPASSRPTDVDRDNPSADFIQTMQDRFVVEHEIDSMLVRKMQRRSGAPYRRITMDELLVSLKGLLDHRITGDYEISDTKWFTGGVSKIQLGFTLTWLDPAAGRRTERMVVRMEPSESNNTTSRLREAQLIQLFEPTLPVPHVFWMDAAGEWFPEPAIIYGYAPGVTKPSQSVTGKISGLGTNFGPELRSKLAPQFMKHLGHIHTKPIGGADLSSFDVPRIGTSDNALWLLNHARRVWEEDRGENNPLMEVAANWLADNLPTLDHLSVVHGDYRSGNFLFNESDGQITAWLDWERGHLGDRHRDLAWTTQKAFGHFDEHGKTYLVCGLVPLQDFYSLYESQTGLRVDHEKLDFYRILNCFQIIVSIQATAYRVARLGKSHQDIMLARVKGMAPVIATEMRQLLREKIS